MRLPTLIGQQRALPCAQETEHVMLWHSPRLDHDGDVFWRLNCGQHRHNWRSLAAMRSNRLPGTVWLGTPACCETQLLPKVGRKSNILGNTIKSFQPRTVLASLLASIPSRISWQATRRAMRKAPLRTWGTLRITLARLSNKSVRFTTSRACESSGRGPHSDLQGHWSLHNSGLQNLTNVLHIWCTTQTLCVGLPIMVNTLMGLLGNQKPIVSLGGPHLHPKLRIYHVWQNDYSFDALQA